MNLSYLLLSPEAYACAVCFSGQENSRIAYIGTTVFLSLLPLAIIYALFAYLRATAREASDHSGQPEA